MRKALMSAGVIAGCLFSVSVPMAAQEVIHALTGTVSAIDSTTKTITVFQDSGSRDVFQEIANPKTHIAFDKRIAAETTAASEFNKQGAYAIVFYFSANDDKTVVALKSLGAGPFASTTGTVTKLDSRAHSISVQDPTGKEQTFMINAQTVAENEVGVAEGLKFQAQRGDRVHVVSTSGDGNPTALFLRLM